MITFIMPIQSEVYPTCRIYIHEFKITYKASSCIEGVSYLLALPGTIKQTVLIYHLLTSVVVAKDVD